MMKHTPNIDQVMRQVSEPKLAKYSDRGKPPAKRNSSGRSSDMDKGIGPSRTASKTSKRAIAEEPINLDEDDEEEDGFMGMMGTQDAGAYDNVNLAQALDDVIELDEEDNEDEYWSNAFEDEYMLVDEYYGQAEAGPSTRSSSSHATSAPTSTRFEPRHDFGPMIHPIKTIDSLPPELQDFYLHHWCRGAGRGQGEDIQSAADRQEEQARVKERETIASRGKGRTGGRGASAAGGWRGKAVWRGRGGLRGRGRAKK